MKLSPRGEAQVHKARGEAQVHEEEVHGPFAVKPKPIRVCATSFLERKKSLCRTLQVQGGLGV